MRLRAMGVLLTVLTGCNTVEDVRRAPVAWTATYPTGFEAMANCLAARSARDFDVTPQLYQRQQRAMVTLGAKGTYSLVGEYQVRQINPAQSEVTWRTVSGLASSQGARARADRCASEIAAAGPQSQPVPSMPPPGPVWAPDPAAPAPSNR